MPDDGDEQRLRHRLGATSKRVVSALRRCPAVEELDHVDLDEASRAVDLANARMLEAVGLTDELAALRNASEEAVFLVATSRVALGVVREVLTALVAAIDIRREAA